MVLMRTKWAFYGYICLDGQNNVGLAGEEEKKKVVDTAEKKPKSLFKLEGLLQSAESMGSTQADKLLLAIETGHTLPFGATGVEGLSTI